MRKTARFLTAVASAIALAPGWAHAASTYVVAPTGGSDNYAGTEAAPFATVGKAQSVATAGDTVLIRGGRFSFSGSGTVGVAFSKSGTASAPINYFAYPGEVPIFDLTDLKPSNRVTGLDVHCNYIHLRGLEVMGVHQYQSGQDSWGVRVQGNGNVIENLDVHNNDAPGIFITSGANNLILNCDSHSNYDYLESGGSGDGFGCHSSGGGNVLRGCRAWDNSDDGFDFINASGTCLVEDSFSFRNGWVPPDSKNGTPGAAAGNGAGFKAGGYGSPPNVPASGAATHTVQRCVAVSNRAQGFYANHHPGRINFYNNTAYNNPANYNMLSDSGYPSSHVIRNNVAFGTGGGMSNLNGGTASFNSWDLSVSVSTGDFERVDMADALGPRKADGSLPDMKFMHLVAGSDLIDAGTDVGLPYVGKAPDLGAFEYGAGDPGGFGGVPGGTGGMRGGAGGTGGAHSSDGAGGTSSVGTGGAISGSGGKSGGGGASGTSSGAGGATAPSGGAAGASLGSGGNGAGASGARTGGASGSGGISHATSESGAGGAVTSSGGQSATGAGGAASGGRTSAGSGGTAGAQTQGTADDGCGCRLGRFPARPSSLLLLPLFLLVLRPRRRGSHSPCSRLRTRRLHDGPRP